MNSWAFLDDVDMDTERKYYTSRVKVVKKQEKVGAGEIVSCVNHTDLNFI